METVRLGSSAHTPDGGASPLACNEASQTVPQAQTATDHVPRKGIAELVKDMGPQKKQIIAIMDYCRQERTSAEIDQMLDALPEQRASVYSNMTMRALLEEAGGLTYISNDANPAEVYDEDGNLVLPEPSTATWLTTEAGAEFVEAHDPYGDLVTALADTKQPAEGLRLVLSLCAEQQRSISEIIESLSHTDFVQDADMDATAFVSALEDAGAIEWQGSWIATNMGTRYLREQGN